MKMEEGANNKEIAIETGRMRRVKMSRRKKCNLERHLQ